MPLVYKPEGAKRKCQRFGSDGRLIKDLKTAATLPDDDRKPSAFKDITATDEMEEVAIELADELSKQEQSTEKNEDQYTVSLEPQPKEASICIL